MKVCRECKEEKPLSEFEPLKYKNRTNIYYRHKFIVCYKIQGKAYRESFLPPPLKVEDLEGEMWKRIESFPKREYWVSNYGRVKAMPSYWNRDEYTLTPIYQRTKYPLIRLTYMYKERVFTIHRLVAKAFHPNPKNKPEVNHLDGIKTNFRADNLEWATKSENRRHALDILKCYVSKGEDHVFAKITNEDAIKISNFKGTSTDLRKMFPMLAISTIDSIRRGEIWSSVTGKKNVRQKRDYEKDKAQIIEIFNFKGRAREYCRQNGIKWSRYMAIKQGKCGSRVTGKKYKRAA